MDQALRKMPAVQHGRGLSCASSSTLNLMILILPQNKRYSYFPGHIIFHSAFFLISPRPTIWNCWVLRAGTRRYKNLSEQRREPTTNSTLM